MKFVIVFAALCAVALCQDLNLAHLIRNEVEAIMASDPTLTEQQCTAKCDEIFKMADAHDETHTDEACAKDCATVIQHLHNTHAAHGHTTAAA